MENSLYCGVGRKSKALRACSRGGTAEAILNLCGTRIDINGKQVDGEEDTARFRKEQAWAVEGTSRTMVKTGFTQSQRSSALLGEKMTQATDEQICIKQPSFSYNWSVGPQ